jgi:hypothetical protein
MTDNTEQAQQPESINLSDLQSLLNVIDLATSRGAFRGNELTQVGAVFDKLDNFLKFVAAQQAAQEEAASEAEQTEELETEEA